MKHLESNKLYLVTGGAGFIGFHLSRDLLETGAKVIGLDNMNKYYDVALKEERLAILKKYKNYSFYKYDLINKKDVFDLFEKNKPDIVVNLAEIGRAHV